MKTYASCRRWRISNPIAYAPSSADAKADEGGLSWPTLRGLRPTWTQCWARAGQAGTHAYWAGIGDASWK
jgi:hypothetical protein